MAHHLRIAKAPHWHIDYLGQVAVIKEVWFSYDPVKQEHAWARAFQNTPGASLSLKGFGSSDCHCASHLFYFEKDIPSDTLLEHDREVIDRN